MTTTTIGDRMRALADTGHAMADELREKATAADIAANGYYAEPQTIGVKSFLGAMARARIVWCKASGEPLV